MTIKYKTFKIIRWVDDTNYPESNWPVAAFIVKLILKKDTHDNYAVFLQYKTGKKYKIISNVWIHDHGEVGELLTKNTAEAICYYTHILEAINNAIKKYPTRYKLL